MAHVDIDFDRTVEDAVGYLYGLGHRRLTLVSGNLNDPLFSTYGPYVRSEAAYRRVAAEYGLETVVMESAGSTGAGQEAMAYLVRDYPDTTAVLIVNEFAALGAVSGLNRLGRRVPDDISVMPLLMAREMAALTNPELTIMRTPGPELGQLGTEALIRQLEGADPLPPELVPARLYPGASTAPLGRVNQPPEGGDQGAAEVGATGAEADRERLEVCR